MPRHLSVEQTVQVARRLDRHEWTWAMSEIGPALEAAGLMPEAALDEPSIRIGHPALPGVPGFVVNRMEHAAVREVNITLTEVVQPADTAAQAVLDTVFRDCLDALISTFGDPDDYPKESVVAWDRGDALLKLRRLGIAVDLSLQGKNGERLRNGG